MALCTCRVESCMGCIPLQRGAIIVGFLYLFGSMLETFKYMYVLVDFELKVRQCEEAEPRRTPELYFEDLKGPIYQALRDDLGFCPKGRMLALARSSMVIPIFIFFIYFILTALMIHGARQDRPKLIAPWLWWQLSLFVVTLLGIIGLQSLEDFLFKITVLLVAMYLFMVVNSYYLELLRRERNPSSRLTVIAMAHPRPEMMVSFPSPLKDDPPPPYHACYIPSEGSFPPPYCATSPNNTSQPPPYQSVDPLMASCSGSAQEEPQPSSIPSAPTVIDSDPANPSSTNASLAIPNPATSTPAITTQAIQEQEKNTEESHSTPEAVGERVPLVVKLPSSSHDN